MYCLEQVVDWCSAPDERIAQVSRLYARPTAVLQTMHPPVEFWLQPDDPDHGIKLCTGGAIAEVLEGGVAAANGVTNTHTLVKVGRQRIVPDMPVRPDMHFPLPQSFLHTKPISRCGTN